MKQLRKLLLESTGLNVIEDRELVRLNDLARLLATYDRSNVIGTKDPDDILSEHIADSLSCLQYAPLREATRVVDVGSGGGLPGIPLSLHSPEASFVLVESNGKKVAFLEHVVEELNVENVIIRRQRVEEFGSQNGSRGLYDFATSRALARLDVVAEYCVPLLHVGGALIAMKAEVSREELDYGRRAAEILGAEIEEVREVRRSSLQTEKSRNLVILRKTKETPEKYPRETGVPTKNPLGSL